MQTFCACTTFIIGLSMVSIVLNLYNYSKEPIVDTYLYNIPITSNDNDDSITVFIYFFGFILITVMSLASDENLFTELLDC